MKQVLLPGDPIRMRMQKAAGEKMPPEERKRRNRIYDRYAS